LKLKDIERNLEKLRKKLVELESQGQKIKEDSDKASAELKELEDRYLAKRKELISKIEDPWHGNDIFGFNFSKKLDPLLVRITELKNEIAHLEALKRCPEDIEEKPIISLKNSSGQYNDLFRSQDHNKFWLYIRSSDKFKELKVIKYSDSPNWLQKLATPRDITYGIQSIGIIITKNCDFWKYVENRPQKLTLGKIAPRSGELVVEK